MYGRYVQTNAVQAGQRRMKAKVFPMVRVTCSVSFFDLPPDFDTTSLLLEEGLETTVSMGGSGEEEEEWEGLVGLVTWEEEEVVVAVVEVVEVLVLAVEDVVLLEVVVLTSDSFLGILGRWIRFHHGSLVVVLTVVVEVVTVVEVVVEDLEARLFHHFLQ